MGQKNITRKRLASAASLAAAYVSESTEVTNLDNIGYAVTTAGITDNTGTWSVQGRNTDGRGNASGWFTLTLTSTPTLANANVNFGIDVIDFPWNEVRLAFTPAGVTPDGTAEIFITVKQRS